MDVHKSPQELLSLVAEKDPYWSQQSGLRADSWPGQFPYKFSFCLAGDRYPFELQQEEVWEISKAPDLREAARTAFSLKMSLVASGRANFHQ